MDITFIMGNIIVNLFYWAYTFVLLLLYVNPHKILENVDANRQMIINDARLIDDFRMPYDRRLV